MTNNQTCSTNGDALTYAQKAAKLDEILTRLDMDHLHRKEAVVVFDESTQTANISPAKNLRR